MNEVKHLYIHIPFCQNICEYCDFKRTISDEKTKDEYLKLILKDIKKYEQNKFSTIYIGGGTPNCLSNEQLEKLISPLSKMLEKKYEFAVECNPELVTNQQVEILVKNKVNRISLGVQSTNNEILKSIGRKHTINDVEKSIKCLYQNGITNVSLDFIYGFNELTKKDLNSAIKFIQKNDIKHVSFYSLEIKEGAKFSNKYLLDEIKVESDLKIIEKKLEEHKFIRYEISNWAIDKKYYSQHNLAYWQTSDWIGIGYGAFGLENKNYYENTGSVLKFKKTKIQYSIEDYYFQVISMGLRLSNGLDLTQKQNLEAYKFFENKIDKTLIIKDKNNVKVKNINLLNTLLLELI